MNISTHTLVNLAVSYGVAKAGHINFNFTDLIMLLSTQLIDIDHLFFSMTLNAKRNPFKTHFFHKHWKLMSLLAVICLFTRIFLFFGIGLIIHFILDYLYIKIYKLENTIDESAVEIINKPSFCFQNKILYNKKVIPRFVLVADYNIRILSIIRIKN